MNILFSTTRQWNPGDEIILYGIRSLFESSRIEHNAIAWNRNPAIRPNNVSLDNSYDEIRHSFHKAIDYVVFSGTPEWRGPRVAPLYRLLLESGVRCAFLGIGGHGNSIALSEIERRVFHELSDLIVCRDAAVYRELNRELDSPPELHLLPCPSIFHSTVHGREHISRRVGVIYQTIYTMHQNVSPNSREQILRLVDFLSKQYDVTVICHYVDEFDEASSLFGSSVVRYSYDAREYADIFRSVDCVVGARVHGCLGAIGVGTPAILLDWETDARRRGTAEQIPVLRRSPLDDPDLLIATIEASRTQEALEEIRRWRDTIQERYLELLMGLPLSRTSNDGLKWQCDFNISKRRLAEYELSRSSRAPESIGAAKRLGLFERLLAVGKAKENATTSR